MIDVAGGDERMRVVDTSSWLSISFLLLSPFFASEGAKQGGCQMPTSLVIE